MPSPFSVFRSNLKPLMVALTLLSLFAFVVLPAISMYLQYRVPGQGDTVVATYNGGSFEYNEVSYYQRLLGQTNRFLAAVDEEVKARGGAPNVPNYGPTQQGGTRYGISLINDPENVVVTKLFAQKASELGLEMDNTAVDLWLAEFTDGKLSANELAAIRAKSSQNTLGKSQMYDLLKTELLASLFQRMLIGGLATTEQVLVSPVETWQNFLKLNQQATATAYPILVEELLDQTDEPAESVVQEIYEDGKERFPLPDSPQPGFRRPYAADLEMVVANFETFLAREIEKLSEEELRAEYQRRLEGGDFLMPPMDLNVTPPSGGEADPEMAPQEPPAESGEGDSPVETAEDPAPAADTSATDAPADEAPASETPASETPAPATEDPNASADEPTADEPAADEPAADEPTADEPTGDEPTGDEPTGDEPTGDGGDGDGSESEPTAAVSREKERFLTALVQQDAPGQEPDQPPTEPESTPAEDAPAEQPPAEQPASEESTEPAPATEQSTPADQPPADQPPADQTPADAAPADAAPGEQAADDAEAGDQPGDTVEGDPAAEGEPAADAEPEPQSFEAVREQIARSLAQAAAREAMDRAINAVYRDMQSYSDEMAFYRDASKNDDSIAKPKRPDLKDLAEQYGLEYQQTGMQNALEIRDNPIGQSTTPSGQSVIALLFNETRPTYYPIRTSNLAEQTEYAVWKVDARPAFVPDLEDVRDEVVAAARLQQARELAQKAAQDLAEQANAADAPPLAELVPESRRNLIFENIGPFPWMQSLGFSFRPFMGEVPELDNVGEEFMRTVFRGPDGQFNVAPNVSKSVFYVVKAGEVTPPAEDLRTQFMRSDQRMMASMMANEDLGEIRTGYDRKFIEEMGLNFNEEALAE